MESIGPRIQSVKVTSDSIVVNLVDGRVVSVPLAWSWRLSEATAKQRARFKLIGDGQGVHRPEIDEDISVEGMLHGVPAQRPQKSVRFSRPQVNGRQAPTNKRLRRSDKARRSTAKR